MYTTRPRKVRSCVSGNELHYHECTTDNVWVGLVAVDFRDGDVCLFVEDGECVDFMEKSFLEFAGEFVLLNPCYPFRAVVKFKYSG